MALIAIACPSCDHRGAVSAETLPRSLQCVACGQARRFDRVTPVLAKMERLKPQRRTRGQRIVALMAVRPARLAW
jgi:hypothetical protein